MKSVEMARLFNNSGSCRKCLTAKHIGHEQWRCCTILGRVWYGHLTFQNGIEKKCEGKVLWLWHRYVIIQMQPYPILSNAPSISIYIVINIKTNLHQLLKPKLFSSNYW